MEPSFGLVNCAEPSAEASHVQGECAAVDCAGPVAGNVCTSMGKLERAVDKDAADEWWAHGREGWRWRLLRNNEVK
eukprot:2554877-Prymnesium_polylepis.2